MKRPPNLLIIKAAEIAGGQRLLAEKLGVPPSLVSQWATGHRPVAARHCGLIESVTEGVVTASALQPDVFCIAQPQKAA